MFRNNRIPGLRRGRGRGRHHRRDGRRSYGRRVIDLLDVNVLIALAWPNHVHHGAAHRWFGQRPLGSTWATTPVTECGFVRVCANRSAVPTAVAPGEAIAMLGRIRDSAGHVFLPDDLQLVLGEQLIQPERVVSHRLVTDAHLLALAKRHDARLATFDRGVAAMAGPDRDQVELISA